MRKVWRSGKIRENGGARPKAAGGHLLAGGKNRDQIEGRQGPRHRGRRFWKNLLGRSFFLSWNETPDDAPPRTRLAPRRRPHRSRDWHKRATRADLKQYGIFDCLVGVLLGASLLVCGCRAPTNPQAVQDQIELTFEHGDLDTASSLADRALQQYRGDPEWLWRFRILKARFLIYRSAYQDALAILQEDPPSSLAATDVGARRSLVQGIAYRVAQDFKKSGERLADAHDLASRNHPQLLCDILNAQTALQFNEREFQKAHATYDPALALARKFRIHYQ